MNNKELKLERTDKDLTPEDVKAFARQVNNLVKSKVFKMLKEYGIPHFFACDLFYSPFLCDLEDKPYTCIKNILAQTQGAMIQAWEELIKNIAREEGIKKPKIIVIEGNEIKIN